MENLTEYITLLLPVVTAIFSEVMVLMISIGKIKAHFTEAKKSVDALNESAQSKELKEQIATLISENYAYKKRLDEVLTQLTRVKVVSDDKQTNTKT